MSSTQWIATADVLVQRTSTRHSYGHRLTDCWQIHLRDAVDRLGQLGWRGPSELGRGRGRYTPHRSLSSLTLRKKVKTRKPFAVSIRTARRNCKGICEVPGLNPGTETAYADSFAKLPSETPDKSDGSNANHDTNNSFPTFLRICVKSVY